ncbi:hypothetical protein XENTR_v10000039 [Xenopus tropicalis]|nr:hypothetical protein XENTR_v10000039 [Xenopus tropicalis]
MLLFDAENVSAHGTYCKHIVPVKNVFLFLSLAYNVEVNTDSTPPMIISPSLVYSSSSTLLILLIFR